MGGLCCPASAAGCCVRPGLRVAHVLHGLMFMWYAAGVDVNRVSPSWLSRAHIRKVSRALAWLLLNQYSPVPRVRSSTAGKDATRHSAITDLCRLRKPGLVSCALSDLVSRTSMDFIGARVA